ncbi:MAG: DUF4231 domain-containing protein [Propionibacteriaceae bacterium]
MGDGEPVDEVWDAQSRWSQVANRLKRRIERYRALTLWLIVLVALLGGLASALAPSYGWASRVLAAVAAVGTTLLPLLRRCWSGRAVRDWTRARSVAEVVKSEVYLWLVRAEGYGSDPQGRALHRKVDAIGDDAAELLPHLQGVRAQHRRLPQVADTRSYFELRVRRQVDDYYRPAAARLTRRLTTFRRAEVVVAVLGAVIAGLSALQQEQLTTWIAVSTAIGAALAIHVSASRLDYLLLEYLRTAERLHRLDRVAADGGYTDVSLVSAAETLITAENKGWMSKLTDDPSPPGG